MDAAAATLREVGRDQPDTLVHGDLHFTNVLHAEREPWLAIDPRGYVGDLAYDGITLLRGHPEALLAAPDPDAHLLRRMGSSPTRRTSAPSARGAGRRPAPYRRRCGVVGAAT